MLGFLIFRNHCLWLVFSLFNFRHRGLKCINKDPFKLLFLRCLICFNTLINFSPAYLHLRLSFDFDVTNSIMIESLNKLHIIFNFFLSLIAWQFTIEYVSQKSFKFAILSQGTEHASLFLHILSYGRFIVLRFLGLSGWLQWSLENSAQTLGAGLPLLRVSY